MRTSLAASGSQRADAGGAPDCNRHCPRATVPMAAAPMVARAVQQEGTSMQVADEW